MIGNKYGCYTKYSRRQLLAKIDDLEKALWQSKVRSDRLRNCYCEEKSRMIRHIEDYAKAPLEYKTAYNCGRTG